MSRFAVTVKPGLFHMNFFVKKQKSLSSSCSEMASNGGATGGRKVSPTNPCAGYDRMRMLIAAAVHARQGPAAFGIGTNGIDTESEEEEVQDNGVTNGKRPASEEAQEQHQDKRARTGVTPPVTSDTPVFTFAEKWMESQREEATKHADLRVKLVEMTYKLESLTERLQRSEAHGLEMETRFQNSENLRLDVELRQREIEASHAKVIEDFTQKLQDSERLRIELERSRIGIATERLNNARLKERMRVACDIMNKMQDAALRGMELLAKVRAIRAEIMNLDPTQASEATDASLMTAEIIELDDEPKQQLSHDQSTLKIQEFVDACLEKCPDHFIYTKDLKRMFSQFCDCAVSERTFIQVLKELGAETKHKTKGNGVVGFKPK